MHESSLAKPKSWRWPRFWWLNVLLFVATLLTTTVFGFALVESFSAGRPFDVDRLVSAWVRFARGDQGVWAGLGFSAPLMVILLAHEFGHYIVCAQRGVNASLPYFLPSPMLFGTFGAFIRIRTPIYTRKSLFDIGIAGPIAGFVVLLPFLIAGVWMSHIVRGAAERGPFLFGTPLALRIAEWIRFPHSSSSDILLHPMAMAAWAGLMATAFNLLPMGQLDGGHILYAVFGPRGHRLISSGVIAILALLGFLYWPWWFWGLVMFFLGRRHPLVYDGTLVSRERVMLSAFALLLFIVCISVVPVRAN
jgi:membrane-associated protease RseP (regulator of RpoE activity)